MTTQTKDIVNTWIHQLAELTGIVPEPLNENGLTSIAFENGIELTIGASDANNVVHLFTSVSDAPEEPWAMYQAMQNVLIFNTTFMGRHTCGIGLSPDQRFFVLHQQVELEGKKLEDFGEMLLDVSTAASEAKAFLKKL